MNIFQKKLNKLTKLLRETMGEENNYYYCRSQMRLMRKQDGEYTIEGLRDVIKSYNKNK